MSITKEWLEKQKVKVDISLQNKLFENSMLDILKNEEIQILKDSNFSIDIENEMASNQGKSDYCWLHASVNLLKGEIKRKFSLKKVNISLSHFIFFDKLERFNMNLEGLIKYKKLNPWKGKKQKYLSINEFGAFYYFRKLIDKYGIMILEDNTEPFHCFNTGMIKYLSQIILIDFDKKIKNLDDKKIEILKEETLSRFYNLLCLIFKKPKNKFVFNNKEYGCVEFYKKYLKSYVENIVCVTNFPEFEIDVAQYSNDNRYPLNAKFKNINVGINTFKRIIINQLKHNELVLASIAANINGDLLRLIYDDNLYNLDKLGFDFSFHKEDTCKYIFGKPNHSICISGVDLDKDNNVKKWKAKNSVGNKANNGYMYMSKEWFDNHCYTAYVNKKYLDKDVLEIIKQKPINADKLYR